MSVKTALVGRCAVGLLAALASLGLVGVSGAGAATFHVSNSVELEEAVSTANANGEANTIILAGGTDYLPEKTLKFKNKGGLQTVEGPAGSPSASGAAAVLSGGNVEPVFSELALVSEGVSVRFKDVEINVAGGQGKPAIEDNGTLGVERSAILGNNGSGIHVGLKGTATVTNSTIADNGEFGVIDHGSASFLNSTVAFNQGAGIENSGTLNLTNTIVAENKGAGDCTAKAATTSDHSLDSNGSCGVGALSSMNPLLTTSGNDGGTTLIHSLKPGSPAISAGDEATCTKEDQRGAPRPGITGKPCSIGADEYSSAVPTIKVPAEITKEAESEAGTVVTYVVEAKDADAVASIECTPESGKTFKVGKTTVKCTAIDAHEDKAEASFMVTVTAKAVATAPTVLTKAASALTETTATLNATVNPNGSMVSECKFEYATAAAFGLTHTYGSTAACASLPGAGSSPVAVSAAITGLTAGTSYDFRIVAVNAGGESKGANETFTTSSPAPVAPTPVTKAASSITETGATLNATVNPNGSMVSECKFEYGTSTAYGKTASCASLPGAGSSPVAVSAAITGLTAGTSYDFRIVAVNAGGESKGANETFTTSSPAPVAPTPVTKAASSITETGATLNATVNPNGSMVSECKFEYGTSTAYGKTASCASLPGAGSSPVAVSAAITGLTAGTSYDFRIVAVNAGGESKGANETFTTSSPAPVAPTVLTKTASAVTETGATLNATVNPNGSMVSECKFEYGTSTAYGKTASCASLPGAGSSPVAVSAAITGLTAGTSYDFRIVAVNAGGESKGANETFTTSSPAPVAPTVLTKTASAVTETGATLNATVNPNGSMVSECKFEYGTSTAYGKTASCASLPGAGSSPVAVSAAITGLTAGTSYDFRIVAVNAGGESKGANETFTTSSPAPVAPTPVTKAASSITETGATLNATVNPNGSMVSECKFEYGTSTAYGKTASCASLPGAGSSPVAVSAAITGLTAGTSYDFRIVAVNAGGESKGANETFTTSSPAPVAPTVLIRELLHRVSSSGIRHQLRFKLTRLLDDALRSLKPPRGHGKELGGSREGGGGLVEGVIRGAFAAPSHELSLDSPLVSLRASKAGRPGCSTRRALEDIEQFIAVIKHDQKRRRPQISASLASAFIQAAQSIETSLSCRSDHGSAAGRSSGR